MIEEEQRRIDTIRLDDEIGAISDEISKHESITPNHHKKGFQIYSIRRVELVKKTYR